MIEVVLIVGRVILVSTFVGILVLGLIVGWRGDEW